jgi:hypothetical protein
LAFAIPSSWRLRPQVRLEFGLSKLEFCLMAEHGADLAGWQNAGDLVPVLLAELVGKAAHGERLKGG